MVVRADSSYPKEFFLRKRCSWYVLVYKDILSTLKFKMPLVLLCSLLNLSQLSFYKYIYFSYFYKYILFSYSHLLFGGRVYFFPLVSSSLAFAHLRI